MSNLISKLLRNFVTFNAAVIFQLENFGKIVKLHFFGKRKQMFAATGSAQHVGRRNLKKKD